jgi:large subunit ribosomal protein L17
MRHLHRGRKLNRSPAHRKALLRNLAKALITHEAITTTLPKANDLRPFVEQLVTFARMDTMHRRRLVMARLGCDVREQALVAKLFDILAQRYMDRPGGYTRITKAGFRFGDSAPVARIAFVVDENEVRV